MYAEVGKFISITVAVSFNLHLFMTQMNVHSYTLVSFNLHINIISLLDNPAIYIYIYN